jgi:arginine-tRNA-protein transferase
MNYKGKYSPSDLLDPISYEWRPIEEFKTKLDTTSFVTFSEIPNRDYPPGWIDPKSITDKDFEKILVLIGGGKVAPLTYIIKFETSKSFRKNITDYVCSVGLDIAHKIIIC